MEVKNIPEVNFYPIDTVPDESENILQTNSPAVAPTSNIVSSPNGSIVKDGTLQSPNYKKNASGWKIDSNGDAEFQSVTAGGYIQVFKQAAIPTSLHINDIWIDTDDGNKYYVAASVGATTIAAGQWVLTNPAVAIGDVTGAGDLAAKDTADFATDVSGATKPANNATVGATFGTNIAGGGSANTQITNDGYATLYRQDKFGNGADGDVTISGNTSLTADAFYNNLTINNGITLNPNGFRIFIKGTLNCVGTGKIASNGGNGGDGPNSMTGGGAAGAIAYSAGTLPIPLAGFAGGNGGGGGDPTAPVAGTNGTSQAKALGVAGVAGGRGGDGLGAAGAAGGTAGAKTGTVLDYPKSYVTAINLFDKNGTAIAQHTVSAGSGGGGGGGHAYGAGGGDGGGGGGSGATGGFVWVAAKTITNINAEAKGGNGGNGGNGDDGNNGVGGGGAGGSGGVILLIYETLTASSLSVAGGNKGLKGTVGRTLNATDGTDGTTGVTIQIQI